jgi:hypothetical protein
MSRTLFQPEDINEKLKIYTKGVIRKDDLEDIYKDTFIKIFSTLVPTNAPTYLQSFIQQWVAHVIVSLEYSNLLNLTTLLQSVTLKRQDDGVLLYFSDGLSRDDSDVILFISMMKTILQELKSKPYIAFYYIFRNDVEIPDSHGRNKQLSRASVSRASVSRASVPRATQVFETTPNSANVSKEINRIVDSIFKKVEDLLKGDDKDIDKEKTRAINEIILSLRGESDAILTSLLEFLKKVKESDIESDIELTSDRKMVTLTLHDAIPLIKRVDDDYCNELTQFLELMTKLRDICTNTLKPIYTNFDSVTVNIPEGPMDSLHKSKKKCAQVKAAAAAAAASQGGGRTHRRKHARKTNRKHNRKTYHKRAHQTRGKRTHRSHRSRAARKHKKYSRRH